MTCDAGMLAPHAGGDSHHKLSLVIEARVYFSHNVSLMTYRHAAADTCKHTLRHTISKTVVTQQKGLQPPHLTCTTAITCSSWRKADAAGRHAGQLMGFARVRGLLPLPQARGGPQQPRLQLLVQRPHQRRLQRALYDLRAHTPTG